MSTPIKKISVLLLVSIALLVYGGGAAYGQTEEAVIATVSPELPGAFQEVTITLRSFLVDLERATITWSIGGKTQLTGAGENKFTFSTGDVGQTTTVRVSISISNLPAIVKSFSITAGDIDLLWEAVGSYTPPFYRGKALPSAETSLKIIAIPNMKSGATRLKPENLVYQWKRNNRADAVNSGFGKNSFTFKGGFAAALEQVEVTASTPDGGLLAGGKGAISIGEPQIVFYENRPLEGIHYEQALPERLILDNEEITVAAEPYFFSGSGRGKGGLSFEWTMNNAVVETEIGDPSSVTLRIPPETSGVSSLAVAISNVKKLLESKEGRILLRFTTQ